MSTDPLRPTPIEPQPYAPGETPAPHRQDETPPASETHLFEDVVDYEPYEKRIRSERNGLYFFAGLYAVLGIVAYFSAGDESIRLINLAFNLFFGALFLLCALWSRKQPFIAFLTAAIIYVAITAFIWYSNPGAFATTSVILRGFIIFGLVRACIQAKKYEDLKRTVGG